MDHFSCNDQLTATAAGKDEVKYKGVRLRKWGKWVSEIRLPNSRERIWLGSYDSAEKAARAFDAAQFCLRGRAGKFNFEESARIGVHLVGGRTGMLTPAEIQEIASQYGNSFSADVLHPSQETQEEFNSAICSAALVPNPTTITTATATFPVSSEAGGAFGMDWPSSSSYYDNILVPNSNNNLPDYGLMMSSLDHMHEDMYMAPHFDHGNINAPDQEEQNVDDQNYSQHSFLWNF